jgi:hypothetical protein
LRENSISVWGKKLYGDVSDGARGLGEDCLSRRQCHECYQRFELGKKSIEGDPKSGRLSTSTDLDHAEKVLAVIRRLTASEVSENWACVKFRAIRV